MLSKASLNNLNLKEHFRSYSAGSLASFRLDIHPAAAASAMLVCLGSEPDLCAAFTR